MSFLSYIKHIKFSHLDLLMDNFRNCPFPLNFDFYRQRSPLGVYDPKTNMFYTLTNTVFRVPYDKKYTETIRRLNDQYKYKTLHFYDMKVTPPVYDPSTFEPICGVTISYTVVPKS